MDGRAAELLNRIEQELFSDNVSLTTLLRNSMILGARVSANRLRDWARLELNGYPDSDETLPSYRMIGAIIQADAIVGRTVIRGQTMSVAQLPKFARDAGITDRIRLGHPIAEIEKIASDATDDVRFTIPGAVEIAAEIDRASGQPYQQIHSLYWRTSPSAVHGVIEQVRTVLAEFIAELVEEQPNGDASKASTKEVDSAIATVVVNVTNDFQPTASATAAGGQVVTGDQFSDISNSTIVNRSLVENSLNRLEVQGLFRNWSAAEGVIDRRAGVVSLR